ncbi:hypothetical protein [Sphingobacterium sp. CZ-UAM]|uniref:hypothetical protein n=1 Tax=Sphingobacterium sp. CZ-UAM TaxID=1933868 RepID=UPI00268C3565
MYNDGHGSNSYFYPGVDAIWHIDQTFKDKLSGLVDYGALRLSYVKTGNGTGAYTANTGAYASNEIYDDYLGRPVLNYSYQSNTLPNQGLKPEQTTKIETGLEFRLFKNRLGADVSIYSQDSKDQIIEFGTPNTSGVSAALLNGGAVRNRGIELVVYGVPFKNGTFSWDTRFNYTRNRNTILSLPFGLEYVAVGSGDGYQAVAKLGGDYGTIIAPYGHARYQAVDANGQPTTSELNGKILLAAPDGTTTIYERAVNYKEGLDKAPVVGSILPKFLGNWRNTFNYKSLQLIIGLDAKFGGMVYSATKDYGSWMGLLKSTLHGRTAEYGGVAFTTRNGTKRNDGVIFDGVYKQGTVSAGGQDLSGMTHQQVVDAGYILPVTTSSYYGNAYSPAYGIRERSMYESSWIALQQVSLSYDLPQAIANKIKMNGLRIAVYGNDLLFLYNNAPDHFNPYGMSDSGSGAVNTGAAMPYVRRFGFSINASF